MNAIGAIFWGFNRPGCFVFATVAENGRVTCVADLKFQHKTEEAVADAVNALAVRHGIRLTSAYGDADLFDLTKPETRKAIPVEPPADVFLRYGLALSPVSGDMIHGWQRLHDYLRDAPDGKPWLVISPSCKTILRTLPTLVQKRTEPDDIGDGPAFAAHALRVLVSARPSPSYLETLKPKPPPYSLAWWDSLDGKPTGRAPLTRHG